MNTNLEKMTQKKLYSTGTIPTPAPDRPDGNERNVNGLTQAEKLL
jgi:hypothetical protein